KRGKVLNAQQLEESTQWGRYKDVDGDGIPYRTIPGSHPTKGSYFTRGSSHDEFARYSEDSDTYKRMVDRIARKFETAKSLLPPPLISYSEESTTGGIYFGTSDHAAKEAIDTFSTEG